MSLKSSKDSPIEQENFSESVSNCWRRERDRICLRVEVRPDEAFIFPYQQFLGAHHLRTAANETLKITLSTHEVALTGQRLEKLLAALQEFAVDWIKPLPPRYRELADNRDVAITAIDVKPLSE